MTEIPRVSDTDLQAIINVHNSGKLTKDKQNHAVQYILRVSRDLLDERKEREKDADKVAAFSKANQKFATENRELTTRVAELEKYIKDINREAEGIEDNLAGMCADWKAKYNALRAAVVAYRNTAGKEVKEQEVAARHIIALLNENRKDDDETQADPTE